MKERLLEDRRGVVEVWLIALILISVITLTVIYLLMGMGWFTVVAFVVAVIFSVIVIPFRERKKSG
jgi:TM2 domain-containing membrane protein YozV